MYYRRAFRSESLSRKAIKTMCSTITVTGRSAMVSLLMRGRTLINPCFILKYSLKTKMPPWWSNISTVISRKMTKAVLSFILAHSDRLSKKRFTRNRSKMFVLHFTSAKNDLSLVLAPSTADLPSQRGNDVHYSEKIFSEERVIDYLLENHIVWPWDVTSESNRQTQVRDDGQCELNYLSVD